MTPDTKRKPDKKRRYRPKHSSLHMTVWTMDGGPMDEDTIEQLQAAFNLVASQSKTRLLHDVRKF